MPISDEVFVKRLVESQEAVHDVARYLRRRGGIVRVPELRVRPSYDERHSYRDGGDIKIEQRVEVRHKNYDFTCREDYPFPSVLVGMPDLLQVPKIQFYGLFSLNRARTHAAIVFGWSRKEWVTITRFDKHYGHERTFVACPKEFVYFDEISGLTTDVEGEVEK